MAATMSELLGNIRRVDIPKADGSPGIFVKYRPQSMTPRKLHEMLALEKELLEAQADALLIEEIATEVISNADDAARAISDAEAAIQHERIVARADDLLDEFASILVDWSLLDNDGNPVPPTLEGLQDVDYEVITYIYGKIREDARVGKSNGTTPLEPSASTSKPTAQQATKRRRSRSGTR